MKGKPAPPKTVETLQAEAAHAMRLHGYRDAIASYKELLKRQPRPEWKEALAQAYLGRAAQVAAKGMYQEAVILFENYMQSLPGSSPSDDYLGWVVRAGQHAKLADLLASGRALPADSPLARRLPEAVAILALENEKLLSRLPVDHPVAKHHPIAKKALAAYAAHRDDETEELLAQIPSRSPYRNLRMLLKALLLAETDRAAASAWLERIEPESVCRAFGQLLADGARTAAPALLERNLSAKQQLFLQRLNGYDKSQIQLLRDVRQAPREASPRLAFETLLRHRNVLGDAASRRGCHALLVEYPAGLAPYERAFGKLPEFERRRIRALHAEWERDYPMASQHWHSCIEILHRQPPDERDTVTEALILRHIAELAAAPLPGLAIDSLEKSLELDPDDRDSYVLLQRLLEEDGDAKAAQVWLDKALKRFPRDVPFLQAAMQAAGRRKAFKKAAGLAKNLLEIDPINLPARQFLIDAHLGHARKQFRAGRADPARQELAQARTLDPQRKNTALGFVEGLLAHHGGDAERADRLLQESWTAAGGSLAAQFQLMVETLSLELPLAGPQKRVPSLDKNLVVGRQELAGFFKLLDRYSGEPKRVSDVLGKLKPILKRSFKQTDLSEEDYLLFSQALARAAQYDSLHGCAQEAARRFPGAPGPIYFEILARCKGQAGRLSGTDVYRLDYALNLAHQRKDQRTAGLITRLLDAHDRAMEPEWLAPPPYPDEDELSEAELAAEIAQQIALLRSYPRSDLIRLLSGGKPAPDLGRLSDDELYELMLKKLFEEIGISPELLGGLPFSAKGKKSSRKSR